MNDKGYLIGAYYFKPLSEEYRTETTMDYQTYKTRKEARAQVDKMQGWDNPRPSQLYIPDDPNANRSGNVWVVKVGKRGRMPFYMRSDGYVR